MATDQKGLYFPPLLNRNLPTDVLYKTCSSQDKQYT